MNLFAASSILITLTSLLLLCLFVFKGPKRGYWVWIVFFAAAIGWGIGGFKIATTSSAIEAFQWWRIAWITVILTPVLYYHTMFVVLQLNRKRHRLILNTAYLLSVLYIGLVYFSPRDFLGGVKYVFNEFYWLDWHQGRSISFISFYILLYWGLLLFAFTHLLFRYKNSKGLEKNQMRYLLIGSVCGWIGPVNNFLIAFGIDVYPYTNISVIFYYIFFAYAVIKLRLLDIKTVITRASLFIAVYTLVLGLPFIVAANFKTLFMKSFGPNWWMVPLAIMGVLATGGPFIYIFFQHRAEARIMKEQRRYQESLKHAAIGMTRIHDLKRLLKLIAHIVTRKVGIAFTSIYLYDENEGVYSLQVSHDKGRKLIPMVSASQDIIQWFQTKALPLIREEIQRFALESRDKIFSELEVEMKLLEAELIIPSFLDKRLIGFIVLGEKLSGAMYSSDDISVFQVLASQAALAIENAQFYSEAKEMQAQISQAEKMATVGTMADGLSHQINNRFYALSLIAGDTLDTLRLTDATKCSPEVQSMLKEINTALERIQVNVMQGGEVVKGILRYTRKGDEGLVALTMDQIIDGTLDMVQFKVKLNDFDIVRDYLKDMPKIKGNLVQMQEVFFNFIDNAYDSMVERRTMLKEPGYRGKITFSAKPEFGMIKIHITDNGMGVKAEDMKRLFTPFFTTKVSSRKGTGLGLYVIRSIITETHHGKISVQSEHKTGTTFIVELPIFHETTPGHLQNT